MKSGGEMVQPPTIDRSSASRRPVDEQFVGKTKKKKEERKVEGKEMGDGAEVMDAKDDLNEANTKLFIG